VEGGFGGEGSWPGPHGSTGSGRPGWAVGFCRLVPRPAIGLRATTVGPLLPVGGPTFEVLCQTGGALEGETEWGVRESSSVIGVGAMSSAAALWGVWTIARVCRGVGGIHACDVGRPVRKSEGGTWERSAMGGLLCARHVAERLEGLVRVVEPKDLVRSRGWIRVRWWVERGAVFVCRLARVGAFICRLYCVDRWGGPLAGGRRSLGRARVLLGAVPRSPTGEVVATKRDSWRRIGRFDGDG